MGFVIEPLKTKSEKCAVEYKTGRGDHVVERVNFVNARLLTNSGAHYFARNFSAKQTNWIIIFHRHKNGNMFVVLWKVCENRKEQSGTIK